MARARTAKPITEGEGSEETTAGETMQLKLVGADTYHCHAVRTDVIQRGEIVEVSVEVGEKLLDDSYRDASNNEHPYFVETSAEEEAAAAARAARRSAKASDAE